MSAWTDHVSKWKNCRLCPLCDQRDRIVLARGSIPADIVFVGEGPGASEDSTGLPFCGPAGRLLDQIIGGSIPTSITYALTNLVCCFPRDAKMEGINEPAVSEILACRPRLHEFITIARPKLIVCVGQLSSQYIGDHDAYGMVLGAKVVEIVHPAAILRMPASQKDMAVQRYVVKLRNAVEEMMEISNATI
jgi:uracil-DNA glycosylase